MVRQKNNAYHRSRYRYIGNTFLTKINDQFTRFVRVNKHIRRMPRTRNFPQGRQRPDGRNGGFRMTKAMQKEVSKQWMLGAAMVPYVYNVANGVALKVPKPMRNAFRELRVPATRQLHRLIQEVGVPPPAWGLNPVIAAPGRAAAPVVIPNPPPPRGRPANLNNYRDQGRRPGHRNVGNQRRRGQRDLPLLRALLAPEA